MHFDVTAIRRQFPILSGKVGHYPLFYLDNAATSQKPEAVLSAMDEFTRHRNANVNRGVHPLAEEATDAFDKARYTVQQFLRAKKSHEIIFTKNATEAINLVARSFGDTLKPGDAIALTMMEHHSNIIPWMQLALRRGVRIVWIPVNDEGQPELPALQKALMNDAVRLVAVTGLSNVLGSAPPLAEIAALAHEHGAKLLVDAAQLAAHETIDVQAMDCDFLALSGHKVYGPTGIGVLYGKESLLDTMPPFLGGGDMIQNVTTEGFTVAELPRKFEAGTPPVTEIVGLAAALGWMKSVSIDAIRTHEASLLAHATEKLATIDGLRLLGPQDPGRRSGVLSFTVEGVHPHDLTDICGKEGICMRSGHHCAQPLHRSLGLAASSRLSVAAYNTEEEIDRAADAINRAVLLLKK